MWSKLHLKAVSGGLRNGKVTDTYVNLIFVESVMNVDNEGSNVSVSLWTNISNHHQLWGRQIELFEFFKQISNRLKRLISLEGEASET